MWEDDGFPRFLRAFTPLDELALLYLGSRPVSRPEAAGRDELAALRAIPWVFSWTRITVHRPRLARRRRRARGRPVDELRRLYRGRSSPRSSRVSRCRARGRAWRSRRYLSLVDDDRLAERVFGTLRAEHERARDAILEVVEAHELLDRHPVLRQSIRLRNPYIDPMNAIQVELLRRRRAGDETALRPLLRSIAGIAAALRNTG